MPTNQRPDLDATDLAIVRFLQEDGRMSTAELARAISMSSSSTADRVRRLTELGVLVGYRAVVDPAALGYTVSAFVRLRLPTPAGRAFHELMDTTPQILEAHHVTGDDCFLLKVIARSISDLEEVAAKIAVFGRITTNIVFRSPVHDRPIPPIADDDLALASA